MGSTKTTPQASPRSGAKSNGARSNAALSSTSEAQSSPVQSDPMDVTPAAASMAPPATNGNYNSVNGSSAATAAASNGNSGGAANAAQQPKVVQTAFIHKLYNMLEDQTIQHLISWSSSNESFLISPSNDFSKVLASYFKHTNISSFVRQLNMYGFHKVSDIFHTGMSDTPLWEFKHGNGNFKRGDLVGLREIKRRASRHSLVHRDSFSTTSKLPGQNPLPGPPEQIPETPDARVGMLEHSLYEVHARLARVEESHAIMSSRLQGVTESLMRSQQYNYDMANFVTALVPDPEAQIHREAVAIQKDISRQIASGQSMMNPQTAPLPPPPGSRAYLSAINDVPGAPLSPGQLPQDTDERRGSLQAPRQSFFRPLAPSPRRYGSIGAANAMPSALRSYHPTLPPPPNAIVQPLQQTPQGAPPDAAQPPRRHTSADIRTTPGWHPGLAAVEPSMQPTGSPFVSGQSSAQWPSSPRQAPGDQQIRDTLARYTLPDPNSSSANTPNYSNARRGSMQPAYTADSRPHSPSGAATQPPPFSLPPPHTDSSNSWHNLPGTRIPFKDTLRNTRLADSMSPSAPNTRRSSMASNVHNLLNPAESAERDESNCDDGQGDERKRKRLV